ncbi:MAG TPA: redox-sensitive transcriptional activator SoxR [Yinghuangia sp.]|uniref:redox-sensitive transcriptional activator SoxR n=1 Tax=Yinghuangia sp. YIM S10712 TaxID=3436930 RepID=UPI002B8AE694|nr:redox-sensitive transcriptional activator SoxR [Yinghuangia sp.]
MKDTDLLTVSEVVHRSGFAASALRFYEREGLIDAQRTGGGQRRYERQVLRRLAFIRAARHVGLTLDEVRQALAMLPQARTPTKGDWARISRSWRARLDAEIAALTTLRDGLDSCIGCGCLSLRSCAISNPGDAAARYGAGARMLPALLREDGPALDGGSASGRGARRPRASAEVDRERDEADDPVADDPCGTGDLAENCFGDVARSDGTHAELVAGDGCAAAFVCD